MNPDRMTVEDMKATADQFTGILKETRDGGAIVPATNWRMAAEICERLEEVSSKLSDLKVILRTIRDGHGGTA
jgi:hypothetical protein